MSSEGKRRWRSAEINRGELEIVIGSDWPEHGELLAPASEAERLRERCSRVEGLLTDVLAILPPELARRVEARMPAINPDEREERE